MFEGDSEESRLDCLGQDKEYKERLETLYTKRSAYSRMFRDRSESAVVISDDSYMNRYLCYWLSNS